VTDWRDDGPGAISPQQRRMLNAVCGDLAAQIVWHGNRLSKDDWRHVLSGTAMGWRLMPGINTGDGTPGLVMLGGSSLSLSRKQATSAIAMGLEVGDTPQDQGLRANPVRWSDTVLHGCGLTENDLNAARAA
jgi:hypothetical protein